MEKEREIYLTKSNRHTGNAKVTVLEIEHPHTLTIQKKVSQITEQCNNYVHSVTGTRYHDRKM